MLDIKQSPDVWGLCVERFSITAYAEVKFWCLQTLHEVRGTQPLQAHAASRRP